MKYSTGVHLDGFNFPTSPAADCTLKLPSVISIPARPTVFWEILEIYDCKINIQINSCCSPSPSFTLFLLLYAWMHGLRCLLSCFSLLSFFFMWLRISQISTQQEKSDLGAKRDIDGMGVPEIKYGDTVCFIMHVATGLWLSYLAPDAKSSRLGPLKRRVRVLCFLLWHIVHDEATSNGCLWFKSCINWLSV